MNNLERFICNETFYDERFYGEHDLTLSIKEYPKLYIHIWDGFLDDIHSPPRVNGDTWRGFTRDFHEEVRTYCGVEVEMENIDEYINDLLLYKDKKMDLGDETTEAYKLIFDFLTFAKENNLTVLADYS